MATTSGRRPRTQSRSSSSVSKRPRYAGSRPLSRAAQAVGLRREEERSRLMYVAAIKRRDLYRRDAGRLAG